MAEGAARHVSPKRGAAAPVNPMLNSLKQVRAALGLLSPEEVRKMADRPVHVGLVAATDSGYAVMEELLVPLEWGPQARAQSMAQLHRASERNPPRNVDLVL